MNQMMRKGSIAIVPIILAIMVLFWFIWFLGGESDQLHRINQVENLQHLQENLLVSAMKLHYELKRAAPATTEAELQSQVDSYIDQMMVLNKIQE